MVTSAQMAVHPVLSGQCRASISTRHTPCTTSIPPCTCNLLRVTALRLRLRGTDKKHKESYLKVGGERLPSKELCLDSREQAHSLGPSPNLSEQFGQNVDVRSIHSGGMTCDEAIQSLPGG